MGLVLGGQRQVKSGAKGFRGSPKPFVEGLVQDCARYFYIHYQLFLETI